MNKLSVSFHNKEWLRLVGGLGAPVGGNSKLSL
jgi:hypothetical protein